MTVRIDKKPLKTTWISALYGRTSLAKKGVVRAYGRDVVLLVPVIPTMFWRANVVGPLTGLRSLPSRTKQIHQLLKLRPLDSSESAKRKAAMDTFGIPTKRRS